MTASAALLLAFAVLGADDKDKDKDKEKKIATIVATLPEADALLWVDDEKQDETGAKREFRTPPLEPGKKYYYLFKARWEPNNYTMITREKKVVVEAGKETKVDMGVKDEGKKDDIVIRYVPTPKLFVDEMMKMANVTEKDTVYDLGCGDGRLVIAAVKDFKAKAGVGVDLDPERLKECKEAAKKAGVEDKVEWRQQDVFKVPDLDKATVVVIYMADEVMEQLWPDFLKRLPNGARIVSHRFVPGDKYKPEKTKELSSGGYTEKIYLWTIKREEKKDDKPKDDKKDEKKDDK
ncbi:MAG: TIGR03000 domain-containing protein [Gemmataceae bacterium]|nr:TIGR03000 domain-containing protein [Gemmataceae bacterium]